MGMKLRFIKALMVLLALTLSLVISQVLYGVLVWMKYATYFLYIVAAISGFWVILPSYAKCRSRNSSLIPWLIYALILSIVFLGLVVVFGMNTLLFLEARLAIAT
ncbi:hypothetical protein VST7929_02930 [Vibrio stylophorae]|uniref:Uncharacterized protein n=1 Tax=Vibrio stylophorae TaxID=659351 RepID=A0ABN8DWH6_9VIBR|nr:hypothetical protein [Vibrio stylophorae]CAH0535330.1 hypothetical protein VST7929_02930 [Vibrio stylophorae]